MEENSANKPQDPANEYIPMRDLQEKASSTLLVDDAKLIADTFRKELTVMEWDNQSGSDQHNSATSNWSCTSSTKSSDSIDLG